MGVNIVVRGVRWPDDRAAILALDTSFTTKRVYQVVATKTMFALEEQAVSPPLHKRYHFDDIDDFPRYTVLVVEVAGRVEGVAALSYEAWNRRAVLQHLFLNPALRGQGVGRYVMAHVAAAASNMDARCIWLETQNINYSAVQFYRQVGFTWCGMDLSLYDPAGPAGQEIALFFARPLEVEDLSVELVNSKL